MQSPSGKATALVVVIIVVLVVAAGVVYQLAKTSDETTTNTNATNSASANMSAAVTATGTTPAELVSTWKSACLTPDESSPWSEQHQFVIISQGTAMHTRWSWYAAECSGSSDTMTSEYLLTVPSDGQVNLVASDDGSNI